MGRFREDGFDRIETHDNIVEEEPHINDNLIVDGENYVIRGVEWLLAADDIGDTKRFICTLVAEPVEK